MTPHWREVKAPVNPIEAAKSLDQAPDPERLGNMLAKNGPLLRRAAKLVHLMCEGKPGHRFFLGCDTLASLLNVSVMTASRLMLQMTAARVLKLTWKGRPCRMDFTGTPYKRGRVRPGKDGQQVRYTDRASEYTYLGLPYTPVKARQPKKTCT